MSNEKEEDQVTTFLRKCQTQNSTLYNHLCQMLTNLPTDKLNGVLHFERISESFKKVNFEPHFPLPERKIEEKINKVVEYPSWIISEEQALKQAKKVTKNDNKLQQNFERVSETLLEPIGISFGAEQNYKINAAMRILGERQRASTLRFWGKILCTGRDYYVIQGVASKNKEPIVQGSTEKYRQGVNYYSYWVSNQIISDDWYELPLVTPEQIVASRFLKYAFTGNLESSVKGYPKFPGKEKHLLKCQLVRITHNCEIVPNGIYARGEENPDEIELTEEFKFPEFGDLTNLENWVHMNPYILALGRADYYKDPNIPEDQREQLLAKLQETDPKVDRLRGINEDKPIEQLGMEGCWVARQQGNLQTFSNVGKDEGTISCYGHVTLKNPHWPGWTTVANSKSFTSVYIGYGIKLTQSAFYPSSPEDLQEEGGDNEEFDEPNPRDPPDELEPDSDDQGKKPDDE